MPVIQEKKRSFLEIISPALQGAIVLVLPVAIYVLGLQAEEARLDREYVQLAISILQPVSEKKEPQRELRQWAVEIMQKKSPVRLTTETVEALVEGKSGFRIYTYNGNTYGGYNILPDESYTYFDPSYDPVDAGHDNKKSKTKRQIPKDDK